MIARVLPSALRQSLFVTGTDTGVGKTHVCCQLLRALAAAGHAAAGMKPVAAGTISTADGPRNEDALALMAAANVPLPYHLANPVCLHAATSPHLAAEAQGISVDLDVIRHAYADILERSDLIIIEGAGGWLAPIGPVGADGCTPRVALSGSAAPRGPTMEDVAQVLRLPILLVVGIRLGALNHALLTAEAIRRSGLPLIGWAANCLDARFADQDRYVQSLAERMPEPLLWRS